MTSDRSSTTALFALAAVLLLAGVIAAIVSGVDGDLANAGDDIVPLLFALAAIAGLAGWYLERRAAAGRVTAAEDERRRLRDELEGSEEERRELHAELGERDRELERRGEELERRAREHAERESELQSQLAERDAGLQRERGLRARLQHAHKVEREWTRELRGQVLALHREQGALAHTGDVREMVLRIALKLVEAEKGLLLSREDRDSDGLLDFVCHVGFDNDPEDSAVAQEFAGQVIDHDATVREDDSSTLRQERRTPADEEIRNLLAIPIYIQDDFGGVIVCANRAEGFEELDDDVLLALGDHAGAVLENGRLHGELRSSYMATVRMLTEALEVKDPSVRVHSDEVAGYVAAVAERLEIGVRRREELLIASLLHDVGKIGISERILLKPGPLTQEERSTIELHPRIGFRLIEQVPALDAIAPAVLHHHERFDGAGYPTGLSGEQIPLEARVICVADSFSAMTSERPYRTALALDDACAELERCAGTQFDAQVVRLFVEEVRSRPPSRDEPEGLAAVLEDPEIRTLRAPGEPILGFGPVTATDNLTLLYGHRYMQEAAAAQAERASVQQRPFAVVLVELAALSEINAREGYAAGDAAIQVAARAVQRSASRGGGTACRYGGGCLGLVIPDTAADAAEAIARELAIELEGLGTSVRTGVAAWHVGETGVQVVGRARLALDVVEVQPSRREPAQTPPPAGWPSPRAGRPGP